MIIDFSVVDFFVCVHLWVRYQCERVDLSICSGSTLAGGMDNCNCIIVAFVRGRMGHEMLL
jgi:hypothetical protein